LKLLYIGYFAAFGISIPFFAPYLWGLGLSGREIALMMSVAPCFHLGVPLLWGWVADRLRRPDLLLRIACIAACLGMAPMVFFRRMPQMLLAYAVHQLSAVAIIGLTDSLAITQARRTGVDYTRLRLWGSASFVLACWVMGPILAARAQGGGDPLVPMAITAAYALTALAAFGIRRAQADEAARAAPHFREVGVLLRNPRLRLLLAIAPLHWASLSPYHGFLGILAIKRGFSPITISYAYVVGVMAELAAFAFFPRLRKRFSLAAMLGAAAAATVVRWLLTALISDPVAMVALQALHAFTFGLFWGAAMAWLAECVPPELRATGQALYTTATFGIGNLIGYLGSGFLVDVSGGAQAAFVAAAAIEVIPLALILGLGRRLQPVPLQETRTATNRSLR
jgi:MFS transporter, PPP family, 3-phenylpropionic acid transporter